MSNHADLDAARGSLATALRAAGCAGEGLDWAATCAHGEGAIDWGPAPGFVAAVLALEDQALALPAGPAKDAVLAAARAVCAEWVWQADRDGPWAFVAGEALRILVVALERNA
jgi:hypothetical protein